MKTNVTYTKHEKMRHPNLIQLQDESEGWKRLLAFILSENVYLKNRISNLLSNDFDQLLLAELESFQNNIIKIDELSNLLRNEIADFDQLLVREVFEDGAIIKELQAKNKKLRTNVEYLEAIFTKLKSAFNNYLSENIES